MDTVPATRFTLLGKANDRELNRQSRIEATSDRLKCGTREAPPMHRHEHCLQRSCYIQQHGDNPCLRDYR
jgi:hypothetical protein